MYVHVKIPHYIPKVNIYQFKINLLVKLMNSSDYSKKAAKEGRERTKRYQRRGFKEGLSENPKSQPRL